MATTTREDGRVGLAGHGIEPARNVYWNPTTSLLYNHAVERGDGRIAEGGALERRHRRAHRALAEGQVRRQ